MEKDTVDELYEDGPKTRKSKKYLSDDKKAGATVQNKNVSLIRPIKEEEEKTKKFSIELRQSYYSKLASASSEYYSELGEASKIGPYCTKVLEAYLNGDLVYKGN